MAVVTGRDQLAEETPVAAQRGFFRVLLRNRNFVIGFIIFTVIAGVAIITDATADPDLRRTNAFRARKCR